MVRALEILGLFLDGGGARSIPEISAALGLPRSTTHELVGTLALRRCLEPAPGEPARFVLGVHVFELGSAYADGIDLVDEGRTVARELADRCDETVHVATLEGTEVLYLAKADSTQTVRMVSAVGRRLPAHCTAVGKVLLAGLDDAEVAARYRNDEEWVRMTARSIDSLEGLQRELGLIRERWLAFDDCESNPDVRCVAAPVRDGDGGVVAGLSISVPVFRAGDIEGPLADLAREAALKLSRRLGFRAASGQAALQGWSRPENAGARRAT